MHVELLKTPPISGMVDERRFDVSARANAWVRSEGDHDGAWVGVFGSSELAPFYAVVPFADDGGRTVLLIAGGRGYVADAQSGSLIRRTPWDYAHAASCARFARTPIVDPLGASLGRSLDQSV